MCIRDSNQTERQGDWKPHRKQVQARRRAAHHSEREVHHQECRHSGQGHCHSARKQQARKLEDLPGRSAPKGCLLYTSDAADERSSVDLGGRRIIKKKKSTEHEGAAVT